MSFCTFSFGHCVVCTSSICGFWPLCCLFFFDIRIMAIVLSVLLRYTDSGHCVVCSSIYGFWLPLLISSNSSYPAMVMWLWIQIKGSNKLQCYLVIDLIKILVHYLWRLNRIKPQQYKLLFLVLKCGSCLNFLKMKNKIICRGRTDENKLRTSIYLFA